MRKSHSLKLVSLLLLFCWKPLAIEASNLALNPSGFEEAVREYKERKYSLALEKFKKMHEGAQCTDLSHYYMALCYQSLNQITNARQEYTSLTRSNDAVLKNNSQQALGALSKWNQHRLYAGNGNVYSRYSSIRPRIAAKPKEIGFDIPASGGG